MSSRDWRVSFEELVSTRYYPPTPEKLTVLNRDIAYYRASNNTDEKELGLTAIHGAVKYAADDMTQQDDELSVPEKNYYKQLYEQPIEQIEGLLETAGVVVHHKRI